MHLLHTPSLSDTHYQPTSPKRDRTWTYQTKHAPTALIQEASKMHSRNIIKSHPCFGFLGMEVSPPMMENVWTWYSCRWPGKGSDSTHTTRGLHR